MALIYETSDFIVEAVDKPHITREDGGHIKIYPKKRALDRQAITPKQAVELMRLTVLAGEAMTKAMNKRGIDIGRINYQDNGNWAVFKPEGSYLHIHLYGRAKSAKIQKYGQACNFPHHQEQPEFYERNEPLNEEDIKEIQKEIEGLLKTEKYETTNWQL
jgi:diadenosine tetraphosphate (Ap4A) HIT family hydrolase